MKNRLMIVIIKQVALQTIIYITSLCYAAQMIYATLRFHNYNKFSYVLLHSAKL